MLPQSEDKWKTSERLKCEACGHVWRHWGLGRSGNHFGASVSCPSCSKRGKIVPNGWTEPEVYMRIQPSVWEETVAGVVKKAGSILSRFGKRKS
jgi:hypothetical protein